MSFLHANRSFFDGPTKRPWHAVMTMPLTALTLARWRQPVNWEPGERSEVEPPWAALMMRATKL
jgi:hypothetical protein